MKSQRLLSGFFNLMRVHPSLKSSIYTMDVRLFTLVDALHGAVSDQMLAVEQVQSWLHLIEDLKVSRLSAEYRLPPVFILP